LTVSNGGNADQNLRLTKRETVAYMHATVTGIRESAHLWVIGADKTQSIALDEIFSKKPVHDGVERSTMNLRSTRKTNVSRNTGIAGNSDEDETDEIIEVPTQDMRGSGLCSGKTGFNLFFMVTLWVTSCFCYGMINIYMKYVPGTIYLNFTVSGVSEILAHVVVGLFYIKLTPRWTFFMGYSIAILGGAFLVFQKKYEENGALVALFVLCAKFGISMSMCACYVSTPYIFPVMLSGTAFGICNIFGRFFDIAAPFMAETDIPLPMEVFTVLSVAGAVLCLFISPADEVPTTGRITAASRKTVDSAADEKSL